MRHRLIMAETQVYTSTHQAITDLKPLCENLKVVSSATLRTACNINWNTDNGKITADDEKLQRKWAEFNSQILQDSSL